MTSYFDSGPAVFLLAASAGQLSLAEEIVSRWRLAPLQFIALTDAAVEQLGRRIESANTVCLCLLDEPNSSLSAALALQLFTLGVPALFVFSGAARFVIGPWTYPGQTACLQCLLTQANYFPHAYTRSGDAAPEAAPADAETLHVRAGLILHELDQVCRDASLLIQGNLLDFGHSADATPHSLQILKDPLCEVCSPWMTRPTEVYYVQD